MKSHLYDIFAEKWCRTGGSVWIYSDPHFGDLDLYKVRFPEEFKNVDYLDDVELQLEYIVKELDEMQIKNINSKCGKNDTLIILGDVGNVECVKKLNAKYKVLILGNHDLGASNYKKFTTHCSKLESEFTFEDKQYRWSLVDPSPCGCIYERTITNNLFDEVYEGTLQISPKIILSHEPVDYKYCFNIHGHVHNKTENSSNHFNCCAENINYTSVNLNQLIKSGCLSNIEDIHRTTIDKAIEKKRDK